MLKNWAENQLTRQGRLISMCPPMNGKKQKSYVASAKKINPGWHLIDADGKILGRLATRVATVLMGKHKPIYTPFLDTGDFVVVVNAEKIRLTGKKRQKKVYQRYSGYPSGRREIPFETMMANKPEEVVREAVRRMLPQTTLGSHMFKKLKVYAGPEHPHKAQQPAVMEIKTS